MVKHSERSDELDPPLSDYELHRLERIRKNEEYLASLGLLKTKDKMIQMTKTTKRNQKRKRVVSATKKNDIPLKRRLSKRLKKPTLKNGKDDGDQLVMLSYADKDDSKLDTVYQASGKKRSSHASSNEEFISDEENEEGEHYPIQARNRRRVRTSYDFALTEEEKKLLQQNKMDQGYLSKFREFLVYHDKISPQNERNVMRQVTKLARGEGVRYESAKYGWPENCYFLKGTPVTPLSDIVELMDQAADAEDRWGRDRGNGWLLSHPLKKLLLFQQFCLKNPDFLTAKCRIQEYYENDD